MLCSIGQILSLWIDFMKFANLKIRQNCYVQQVGDRVYDIVVMYSFVETKL